MELGMKTFQRDLPPVIISTMCGSRETDPKLAFSGHEIHSKILKR